MKQAMDFPSRIGLGTSQFGDPLGASMTDSEVKAIVQAAYDKGVRHVDTAEGYGDGRSEELVGKALQGKSDVFVASKIGWKETAQQAVEAVDASRARLRRDIIDLVYLHWPRKGRDLRPVMEGLERARAAGKVRRVGVSNFEVPQLAAASAVARIDAIQICYNLLWRYPEAALIPHCIENGIAVVTYSTLAQGLLTGKFPERPEFRPGDTRPATVYYDAAVYPHVYEAVTGMLQAASGSGLKLAQMALLWALRQPGIAGALFGARAVSQAEETAAVGPLLQSSSLPGNLEAKLRTLTEISSSAMKFIPDIGNIFKYYP